MLLVIGLAALSLMSCTPAALARGRRVLVPNCSGGHGLFEPERITISCGDGGILVRTIRYSSYGGSQARAAGVFEENLCRPTCGAGDFHRHSGKLELSAIARCGGRFYYTRLRYQFSGPAGRGVDVLTPPGCQASSSSTVVAHKATRAELAALTAAAVTYRDSVFSPSDDYLGRARVTNNGWAYAKEEARSRSEQSDTAFLFRRVHGHWHVAAYSDVFVNQPGVPRAVLKALGLER
jgi:hypothetical protein